MNWYQATSKKPNDESNPRFCSGRMTLIEFICFHLFIIINTLLVGGALLMYFFIIPEQLQAMLDSPSSNRSPARISKVAIGPFQQEGFTIDMSVTINPFIPFPVYAGIGNLNITATHQDKNLLTISSPGGNVWLNQQNAIQPDLTFAWNLNQQENMQEFLADYSNNSLDGSKLTFYFCPEIKLYSLTIYRSLCLHYSTDLDSVNPSNHNAKKLKKNAPSFILEAPDTKLAQDMLTANFGIDELSSFSSDFKFMWKKLFVYSNDDTISFEFVLEFVNPTVFELSLIEKIDFFIELMGTKVVKVSLIKLGLSPALNNAFDMRIDLKFISGALDPHDTQLAIERASRSYAESEDFQIAFAGPFNITKAGFATSITEKFKYTTSFKDTISSISSHSENSDSLTFASLVENSNISISILPTQIDAFLGIHVPALSSLKPPLNYSFPFFVVFDLYGSDVSQEKIIHTSISPVVLQKTFKGFGIETNASFVPVNSVAAATALASSINPLLSRTPSAAKIGLKDFSLSNDGINSFAWCKRIFGERVIVLNLKPSNQSNMMSSFLTQNKSALASLDGNIDITQLQNQPGFRAKGIMKIPANPDVKVDIGYFSLQSSIESVSFASLELPSGLQLSPQQDSISIDANAVISRNSFLAQKVQRLADYYFSSSPPPSFFGISGIVFGTSPNSNIITFSKILLEIESSKILGSEKSSFSLAHPAMKLEKTDIKVPSASQASVAITGTFANPFPCNIALGEISFDTLLEGKQLVAVSLSPLRIDSGRAPLSLQIDMRSDSIQDEDLAEKVKTLYMSLFKGGQKSIMATVTNIVLNPLGSGEGIINQFQAVKFTSDMGGSTYKSSGSFLDYSSIYEPHSNSPLISSIDQLIFKAQPNQNIFAGSNFSYSNPYPISIDIPFLSFSSLLNEEALVNFQLSSLNFVNLGNGYMAPRVQMQFFNREGLPESFSDLYSDLCFKKDEVRGNVYILNFQFGEGSQGRNLLLSKIPFEITSALKSYFTSSSPSLSSDIKAAVDYANIRVLPADMINFSSSTSIVSKCAFDIDFPHIFVIPGIDDIKFGYVSTNLQIYSEKLKLDGELQIYDTDELADSLDSFYQSYVNAKAISATLVASQLVFGYSKADSIQLFSKVDLKHKVDDINGKETQSSSTLLPTIKFVNASIAAAPYRTIISDSHIEFQNNYNLTVSGVGYFASSIGVDEVSVVDLSSSGAEISSGSNQIVAHLTAYFPSSSRIQNKVASFGSNLWNSYGKTTEKISCNRILFGVSEKDHIKAFSKVKISVESSKIFSPNGEKKLKNSRLLSFSNIALKFNPSNMINAAIDGALNLSYHISASMPFFSFGGDLDSHHLFDITLNNLSVSKGNNNFSLLSEIYLQDDSALSTKIGGLYDEYNAGSKLSGSAQGGFLKFGIDRNEQHLIDTFSKLRLGIELESLRNRLSSPSNDSSINNVDLVTDKLMFSILPGKVLSTDFSAIFNSSYPLSIEGLDFVSSNIAIDDVPIVNLHINGFKIAHGTNDLKLHSNLMFHSGDLVASSVSKLYESYESHLPVATSLVAFETIFGFDSQHAFSLFSKCKLNGTSSLKSFFNSSNSSSMPLFSEYLLPKFHLNTLASGEFRLDTVAKLKNSSLIVDGQIGFLQVNSLIDNQNLGILSLSSINATHIQQDIDLEFSGLILFNNDSRIQDLTSIIFDKYLNHNIMNNTLQFSGFLIGSNQSAENTIDAFSKIAFRRNLKDLLEKKSLNSSSLLPSGFSYNVSYVDLDLYDDNVISSKWSASINHKFEHQPDFDIDIPFVSLSMLYNQSDFITCTLHSTTIHDSIASTTLLVKSHGNKPAWNSIAYTFGLIENNEVVPVPDLLRFQGFSFGTVSAPIYTFSKLSFIEPLNNITSHFSGASNRSNFIDLQVEVLPGGLVADALTTWDYPFFHNNLDIAFESHFHAHRSGPAHPYAVYKITSLSLPNAKMLITPIFTNNSASVALKDYFSVFATDYLAEDSRYGYVTIKSKNGHSFTDFSEAYFYGSRGKNWAPYVVDIVPPNDWTWDVENAGYLNGPFNIKGKFHNFGYTHLSIGDLFIHVNVSGKPLVSIETVKPLIILNYREGGATYEQAKYPVMGELGILWPKEFYGEFWLTHVLGALYEAKKDPSVVTFEYGFTRNGTLVPYINQVIDNMPTEANTNSSFSICHLLNVMRLEIFDKPDWEYPFLVPFEHSINNLFLHCNFTTPSPTIPLQRFLKNIVLVNSKQNISSAIVSNTSQIL